MRPIPIRRCCRRIRRAVPGCGASPLIVAAGLPSADRAAACANISSTSSRSTRIPATMVPELAPRRIDRAGDQSQGQGDRQIRPRRSDHHRRHLPRQPGGGWPPSSRSISGRSRTSSASSMPPCRTRRLRRRTRSNSPARRRRCRQIRTRRVYCRRAAVAPDRPPAEWSAPRHPGCARSRPRSIPGTAAPGSRAYAAPARSPRIRRSAAGS